MTELEIQKFRRSFGRRVKENSPKDSLFGLLPALLQQRRYSIKGIPQGNSLKRWSERVTTSVALVPENSGYAGTVPNDSGWGNIEYHRKYACLRRENHLHFQRQRELTMTPQEFQMVYPMLSQWISSVLKAFEGQARSVALAGFPRLPHYYPAEFLERSKFVIVPRIPLPPLSQMGLSQFAAFENSDFAGITYLDTFFVRHREETESLFFHELVHVVQWSLLGPESFLSTYADGLEKFGYANSPLEAMAYTAQGRFEHSVERFDVIETVKLELTKLGQWHTS